MQKTEKTAVRWGMHLLQNSYVMAVAAEAVAKDWMLSAVKILVLLRARAQKPTPAVEAVEERIKITARVLFRKPPETAVPAALPSGCT